MRAQDAAMYSRIADFLPGYIFDAHAHFYTREQAPAFAPGATERTGRADYSLYRETLAPVYGERNVYVNALPAVDVSNKNRLITDRSTGMRETVNAFLLSETAAHGDVCAELCVLPGDSGEYLSSMAEEGARISGFKCYHTAAEGDNLQADIGEYLPEGAWEAAEEQGLAITLHLVKTAALAHPSNMSYIISHLKRYRRAKLILAHAARGFASSSCVDHIGELAEFDNLYVDLSAVAEPLPVAACIKALSARRVMFGTDWPLCLSYGKCVSFGNGFLWLTDGALDGLPMPFAQPCLNILEQLTAIYDAANLLSLPRADVERIFYKTAAEALLGI